MKLDYETVYRAVKGNHDAQEKLLQYYDAHISVHCQLWLRFVQTAQNTSMCVKIRKQRYKQSIWRHFLSVR